jgi:hypothetical protein
VHVASVRSATKSDGHPIILVKHAHKLNLTCAHSDQMGFMRSKDYRKAWTTALSRGGRMYHPPHA